MVSYYISVDVFTVEFSNTRIVNPNQCMLRGDEEKSFRRLNERYPDGATGVDQRERACLRTIELFE